MVSNLRATSAGHSCVSLLLVEQRKFSHKKVNVNEMGITNKLAGLVNLNTVGNLELLDIYFIFIGTKGNSNAICVQDSNNHSHVKSSLTNYFLS